MIHVGTAINGARYPLMTSVKALLVRQGLAALLVLTAALPGAGAATGFDGGATASGLAADLPATDGLKQNGARDFSPGPQIYDDEHVGPQIYEKGDLAGQDLYEENELYEGRD